MEVTVSLVETPPALPPKVEERIAQYVAVRDAIKEATVKFDEQMAPLKELQDKLTGWLQQFMDTSGVDSVKTSGGTAYSSTKFTASLADPEVFMQFVIANQNFDLLDRKANVTAVKEYTSENGQPPPGVNLSSIKTVNVRRPTGKS